MPGSVVGGHSYPRVVGTYWKRWVGLVIFAVVLVTAFVRLGQWQLDRRDQKRERNAVIVAQQRAPVASFDEAFAGRITPDKQYRRVSVQGTFDATHQLQVRYRTNNGAMGYEVVAPLRTTSGKWLLVDRGFGERQAMGALPAASSLPAPPTGVVTVEGYVLADEPGSANAVDPVDGSTRLINPPAIAAWSKLPLVDGYLSATSIRPPQEGNLVPVALPELTEGPHMSYAMQWFSFAIIGVVGTFILIGKDAREIIAGRRRQPATGDPEGPSTDGPEDDPATAPGPTATADASSH